MIPVNIKIPTEEELGTTADLHDVVGFIEHATSCFRQAGYEPSWHGDVSDIVNYYAIDEIPPRINGKCPRMSPDIVLEIAMYHSGWVEVGHESRKKHLLDEGPPLYTDSHVNKGHLAAGAVRPLADDDSEMWY